MYVIYIYIYIYINIYIYIYIYIYIKPKTLNCPIFYGYWIDPYSQLVIVVTGVHFAFYLSSSLSVSSLILYTQLHE